MKATRDKRNTNTNNKGKGIREGKTQQDNTHY